MLIYSIAITEVVWHHNILPNENKKNVVENFLRFYTLYSWPLNLGLTLSNELKQKKKR